MLNSKELRQKARESLKGKYMYAFIASLIASILIGLGLSLEACATRIAEIPKFVLENGIQLDKIMTLGAAVITGMAAVISVIAFLLSIFVGYPTIIGECNYYIKNTGSKPAISEVFSGFKSKYGRNIGIMLLIEIKLLLWTCLFIIPGIIKAFEYSIIPYILADDPEISSKDAFKKAKEMMKGNKWRLFKLNFSFIGWFLLCCVPVFIFILLAAVLQVHADVATPITFVLALLSIFLFPYINAANAEFYVELKNK